MKIAQLPRAVRAFRSVLSDQLFLNLPAEHRDNAACDLDDASLVKWSRWALASVAKFYVADASRRGREVDEVTTQHGVIALARLVLSTNSTSGTFDVGGVTYRNRELGDWRVTIEQVSEATHDRG